MSSSNGAKTDTIRGFTVSDLAARFRVSQDRVRRWIDAGLLRAFNRRDGVGRPAWVVTPEALADFERGRAPAATPKPTRRKKHLAVRDYYPD
jgi:hypothetical protein